MSLDVPRRPPLTREQRERNARNSGGAQVAEGATGDAKRVQTPRGNQIYQPPVEAASGGPIGRLDYACTTTPSMTTPGGFGWVAPNGALSLHAEYGDTSSIVYDAVELGLTCTEAGWYRMAAGVLVDSATAGDLLSLAAFAGTAGNGDHYMGAAVASSGGKALLSATSPEIYVAAPTSLLASFTVTNETAARGRIASGVLTVVRLS